jgi:hypothetical protein
MSSKLEVLKHLKEGFAYGRQSIAGLDASKITGLHKSFGHDRQVIEMTLDMTDDLREHLGQLIAYADEWGQAALEQIASSLCLPTPRERALYLIKVAGSH